jgi:hypothetical protein
MAVKYLSYFNIPPAGGSSLTIRNKLLAYINGATPGSEIRGHITRMGHDEIAAALINANKEKGVQVYLVQDGLEAVQPEPDPTTPGAKLEKHFGTRHKYCYQLLPDGRYHTSCVSSAFDAGDTATHHIKNWLFSSTVVDGTTRLYSTWVTSYNLTDTSDGQFNDVFIVNNNKELYDAYVKSFVHYYGQRRSDDFYNVAGRGHHVIPSAAAEISFSPQKHNPDIPDDDPGNDYVARALSRIDGFEEGCSLKVGVLSISSSRKAIIKELLRIRALGCPVQIAFTTSYLSPSAMIQLLSAQVGFRMACGPAIHSKMMLYSGQYDGNSGRKLVWGGSHNWNSGSLRMNDEVFVAISDRDLYYSYYDYFDVICERSTPFVR